MLRALVALPLLISACQPDQTASAYADPLATYRLLEIDAAAVSFAATLRFPSASQISGQGPCNSYGAELSAPYPWFALGKFTATERACPDLETEQKFFNALSTMAFAEISGPVLVLTNDAGREMVFSSEN